MSDKSDTELEDLTNKDRSSIAANPLPFLMITISFF